MGTSTLTKYYYAGNQRVALRVNSGSVTYLLSDHLGSTVRSATASGSPGSELRYTAFGETCYESGTMPTRRGYTG